MMQESVAEAASQPEKSGFKKLLRSWDTGLLLATILAMLVMTGYLLWPQPVAQLKLQTLTSSASGETVLPAQPEVSPAQAVSKPPSRYPVTPKKPAHPPILNLNTASLSQLQLLPGIGPKMAQRIVEYRKNKGTFQSGEQVMEVKGIGEKKFEKLKPYLKV